MRLRIALISAISLSLWTTEAQADEDVYYSFNDTYVTNTSSDGKSPNEKLRFVSDVYSNTCYISPDAKRSFKSLVEARHFTKVHFEYIHDGHITSSKTEQQAQDERNKHISELKRDGWRVVDVPFRFDCKR
jgi:hypothetical protein